MVLFNYDINFVKSSIKFLFCGWENERLERLIEV